MCDLIKVYAVVIEYSHYLNLDLISLYSFPKAARTKYLKWGGLNNKNLSSHSPGGQKSKIKVPAVLVQRNYTMSVSYLWWFSDNLWCSLACSCFTLVSVFMFTWHSSCVCMFPDFFFLKDINHIGFRAHFILNKLITSAIILFPNDVTFWGTRVLQLQQDTILPIMDRNSGFFPSHQSYALLDISIESRKTSNTKYNKTKMQATKQPKQSSSFCRQVVFV